MESIKDFPENTNQYFDILSFFISGHKSNFRVFLASDRRGPPKTLNGIGGRVSRHGDYGFCFNIDHNDYMSGFQTFLFSLKNEEDGSYYLSESQRDFLFDFENKKDLQRNDSARPYIRALICIWLEKLGVYVSDFLYAGHIVSETTRNSFLVRSFKIPKEGGLEFDDIVRSTNPIIIPERKLKMIQKGITDVAANIHSSSEDLYVAALRAFIGELPEKDAQNIERGNRLVQKAFKNR